MTPASHAAVPPRTHPSRGAPLVHTWTQRLAAGGFGVRSSRWRGRHELIILNVPGGQSSLTITGGGHAHWYYEPRARPPRAAVLAAIIVHILGAPRPADAASGVAAYRAFPLKGAVGRCLQDRGLAVALRISEDPESFEATTSIQVTSPARPWLGTRAAQRRRPPRMGLRLPRRLPRRPRRTDRRDRPHPARRPHLDWIYPVTGQLADQVQSGCPRPVPAADAAPAAGRCRRLPEE